MSESSTPPRRRFVPEPVETTTKSVRKFAVVPVETTTRSSKDIKDADSPEMAKPPTKRRFLPQPVETSMKSSKASSKTGTKRDPLPTPEPSPQNSQVGEDDSIVEETPKTSRKFAPQLIETTRRSKRAGDTRPATLPTDKTDITPGTNHIYLPRRRKVLTAGSSRASASPINTPPSGYNPAVPPPYPPRRQGSMKPHLNTRRSTRQDSFKPGLDDIESSESDPDAEMTDVTDVSESASYTGIDTVTNADGPIEMADSRETCDDRFSGYLLDLAAKAAEKQLREQALAAYPNSDYHNPVEHYYDREVSPSDDEDEDDIYGVGLLPHERMESVRRKSTEVGWAAREMQQHQEHLARLREEETHRMIAAEASRPTFPDPFWTNGMTQKLAGINIEDRQKAAELATMRFAAAPPMLGSDLKFRMCPSPQATEVHPDQKPFHSPARKDGGGLWGGYCVAEEQCQYIAPVQRGPQMLRTPANEPEDPFASLSEKTPTNKTPKKRSRPGSPDSKAGGFHMLTGITERLNAEVVKAKARENLLAEFDDNFVTQVYNYLSLGYPTLARQYDEEIAKITHVPEEELCRNDRKQRARGYIGLMETDNDKKELRSKAKNGLGKEGGCERWKALKLYIQEWARQHPDPDGDVATMQAWGVRARRGSWAI